MSHSIGVPATTIQLGLRENAAQFSLLVLVNAFVGAMVGLERSILPAIAEQEFALTAKTAMLSFIVVFGVAKALTNYGTLAFYSSRGGGPQIWTIRSDGSRRRRALRQQVVHSCSPCGSPSPSR